MPASQHYTGILLAAGAGRRFDPTGTRSKLLQRLPGGATVVSRAAAALRSAVPVLAVVPTGFPVLAAHLSAEGYPITKCANASYGIANSLVHALALTRNANGWIIALGDMPFVQPSTIKALLDALKSGATIAVPVCAGRRGNPVAFSRVHLDEMLRLTGDTGARALLKVHEVDEVQVADPGIFHDIDTPADLAEYQKKKEDSLA
jgi:molybdenum cofactor cytidylyltransferase